MTVALSFRNESNPADSETLLHRENMENFIHRENIAIFKRRLAETKDATVRGMLQQLLAAEQAKDVTPKSER
jgi:hypothetical protein